MMNTKRHRSERGFAMMMVMGAVAAVFVIGLVLLSGLPAEARVSRNLVNRERAVFLAESGIAEALHRLENPPVPGTTWNGTTDRSIGGDGTYTVTVTDEGDDIYRIESTGQVSVGGAESAAQQIAMLVQMGSNEVINYDISDETVTVSQRFAARTGVAGVEISDLPVTVRIRIGDQVYDPFGNYTSATGGNINTGNDFDFSLPDEYDAGTTVNIEATSWQKKRSWYSGNSDSHYSKHMTVSTNENSDMVKVLRDGDSLPDVTAYNGQAEVSELIADYVDAESGTVKLADNQVIYLFELYTTNLNSIYADFQDLVLVVDFAKDVETLETTSTTTESSSGNGGNVGVLEWTRKTVPNTASVVVGGE